MIAIIDNYDSFTYNLVHLVKELGAETCVLRNDCFRLDELKRYDKILLSPGPGIPEEAGLLMDTIRTYAESKPILGICLGEQAIGEAFGARLENLSEVFHGIASEIQVVSDDILFKDMPGTFMAGRYHSWVVSKEDFPECLEITAVDTRDNRIMGLRHRHYDVRGIQFHPESVLTPQGKTIIRNWLNC